MKKSNSLGDKFTSWSPEPGFLILLPSRLPKIKGGIHLPETHTKKNNSGICIKAGTEIEQELLIDRECFFPNHSEYQIIDSDTDFMIYLVKADSVLMTRIPPKEVALVSREKTGEEDRIQPPTVTHPTPNPQDH